MFKGLKFFFFFWGIEWWGEGGYFVFVFDYSLCFKKETTRPTEINLAYVSFGEGGTLAQLKAKVPSPDQIFICGGGGGEEYSGHHTLNRIDLL